MVSQSKIILCQQHSEQEERKLQSIRYQSSSLQPSLATFSHRNFSHVQHTTDQCSFFFHNCMESLSMKNKTLLLGIHKMFTPRIQQNAWTVPISDDKKCTFITKADSKQDGFLIFTICNTALYSRLSFLWFLLKKLMIVV